MKCNLRKKFNVTKYLKIFTGWCGMPPNFLSRYLMLLSSAYNILKILKTGGRIFLKHNRKNRYQHLGQTGSPYRHIYSVDNSCYILKCFLQFFDTGAKKLT